MPMAPGNQAALPASTFRPEGSVVLYIRLEQIVADCGRSLLICCGTGEKDRSNVTRPSLKITRHDDRKPPGDFSFEVWNPFTAGCEAKASLDDGLDRVTELAEQVRVMWVRHDPARAFLKDAPDPDEDDDTEWAELRVSAQSSRVYETRNFDQRKWKKAMSRTAAIETTCNEVGYVPS